MVIWPKDCRKGLPLLEAMAARSFVLGGNNKSILKPAPRVSPTRSSLLEKYKHIATSKKYRQSLNSFIAPGLVCIKDCRPDKIKSILACSTDALSKLEAVVKMPQFIPVNLISDKQYFSLTNEHNPHGIVAEVEMLKVERFTNEMLATKKRWIGVNGIRDGANLGLLMRTVGCLGWDGVVMIGPGNVDPFCVATVRASAGAIFKIPLCFVDSFQELSHVQLVLAEVPQKSNGGTSVANNNEPLMLVLGNEQHGHINNPDKCIHMTIPVTPGFGSLNVAVAGGILMKHINVVNNN